MNSDRPSVFGAPVVGQPGTVRRSDSWNPTLTIRFEDGPCTTFVYAHLIWLNFYPSKGIILHFASHTVWVVGRNLTGLYDELSDLRRREIVVVREEHDLGEADAVVVHRVGVRQEAPGQPRSEDFPK